MLFLRSVRRFYRAISATTIASPKDTQSALCRAGNSAASLGLEEPALVRLKSERDPHKIFQLFKANASNKLVVENRFVFEDVVSRLAGARRFDYIKMLLEEQKRLPQGRREGFVVRIIVLYGRAGMVRNAVGTFYDMHLFGCKRSVKSFNAALKVLTQTRDLKVILEFLAEVPQKYDIEIDIISVNIVVKAFCEMGNLDEGYLVMVEMERLGLRPDVVSYTTLLSAFYRNNQFEIGNGLWNLMIHRGCLPNVTTFNVRIQYLVEKRRSWQANGLLMTMPKVGIEPDEVTFNLVIKGFCQAGHLEMAKKVYSALLAKGLKPNLKIYQTLIHYMCKGEEIHFAYEICKDCMKKNWFPNVVTIQDLLCGLKSNGKLHEANFLMKLIREKVPCYSSEQCKIFKAILSGG